LRLGHSGLIVIGNKGFIELSSPASDEVLGFRLAFANELAEIGAFGGDNVSHRVSPYDFVNARGDLMHLKYPAD
jgi:hypothetical protein